MWDADLKRLVAGERIHIEADLSDADLRGMNLSGMDFYCANLRGANLYGANLRGCDLRGARLNGADLRFAYIHGARLPSPSALTETNLLSAAFFDAEISPWTVTITGTHMTIGCQDHSHADWAGFKDYNFAEMSPIFGIHFAARWRTHLLALCAFYAEYAKSLTEETP